MNPNKKILILDDEQSVLDSYTSILQPKQANRLIQSSRGNVPSPVAQTQFAFQANTFLTGEDALTAIESARKNGEPFAAGFFDVKLKGGIDGIETIRRAKDIDPQLLCVVVTAFQDRSIEEISQLFGSEFSDRWSFISKPFTPAEIKQKAFSLVADWDRRKREKQYIVQIKEQQEQLLEAERMAAIGTLARGIGHEFGNVLLGISGNAELALQAKDNQERKEALDNIEKASERGNVIIKNLTSIVRMEKSRAQIDIRTPIESAAGLLAHEFKKHQVQFEKDFPSQPTVVSINEVEVGQVFLNLFINAIHAMEPNGGKLNVKVHSANSQIEVSVTDSGCGIADDALQSIFKPLFTTKGKKGSGLGLAVTKKIVTNHSGEISVTSQPAAGTTFRIVLPKG